MDQYPGAGNYQGLSAKTQAVLVIALIASLAGSAALYRRQEKSLRLKVENELSAIADLKKNSIESWREARLSDAAVLTESPFLAEGIRHFIADPNPENTDKLRARFQSLRDHYRYYEVLLVSPDGKMLFSLRGMSGFFDRDAHKEFAEALNKRGPVISNIHVCEIFSSPHISVFAPLFIGKGKTSTPLGMIILVSDAKQYLYPLIQSWPTLSKTAETLLVQRDGNDVLFLNDLRHRPDTALKLRIPLTSTEIPAVKAVLGSEGVIDGKDYRGVAVISVSRDIKDSPWHIVAKIDVSEAFAGWRFISLMMYAMFFAIIAFVAGAWFVFYKSRQKDFYQKLYQSEADLHASSERYGIVLRSIGDAVMIADAAGRVEFLNPVAESLTGWKNIEARGKPADEIFRIIDNETRAKTACPVGQVLRDGNIINMQSNTLLVAKDATERPIADSAAPIRDPQGIITGAVLVFRDRSEERRAEAELRHSEEMFRTFFDNSPVGKSIISLEGKFLRVNHALCAMLGYTTAEMQSAAFHYITHADDIDISNKSMQVLSSGEKEKATFQKRYYAKDGSIVWVEVTAGLLRDAKGEPLYFLANIQDITERKRADEALRVSEEKHRLLFESSRDAIMTIAPPLWLFTSGNKATLDMFGLKDDEALRKTGPWLLSPETQPDGRLSSDKALEMIAKAMMKGSNFFEWEHMRADGVSFPAEVLLTRIDSGDKPFLQATVRDISERRHAEADREKLQSALSQSQKMDSIGRLAGGVAHDFNNIMAVIMGNIDLIRNEMPENDPDREMIEEVWNASQRSSALTHKLLAFARRQPVSPRALNLNETVAEMLKMLKRIIGENIELDWMPGHGLWLVKIDPAQIDQILANLCVNSRDAITGVGKITIRAENTSLDGAYCALHPGSAPGEYVLLSVADDGSGMTKETLEHVFEPFFTTKGIGKGTGLGLSTVYGIVKQNNCHIDIASLPGQGTTFSIYLPRYIGDEPGVEVETQAESNKGHGETILILEDDPVVLRMGKRILENLGYNVIAANAPADALAIAGHNAGKIDLLITDVIMPDINGREVSERVKALNPGIKCLFMSGYTADVIAASGILQEGVNFIEKPFTINKLASKVREVLA